MIKLTIISALLISLNIFSCPLRSYNLCRLFYQFDKDNDRVLRYEEMTRMYHSKDLNFEGSIINKIDLPEAKYQTKKNFAKTIYYFTCKKKERIDTMNGDYTVKLAQFVMDDKWIQNDWKLNIFDFERVYNLIKL